MDHFQIPRNPAGLLGLGQDSALIRLLRACGAEEACVTGDASDYDRFLALAAALPLCEGHPLRDSVNATLATATGLSAPLCPHTARAHWDAWVEKHWYGREGLPELFPHRCPLCTSALPQVLGGGEVLRLPEPREVRAGDLSAWSHALVAALPEDGRYVRLDIPSDYAFVRPDPYHAGQAVGRIAQGDALTRVERDLLLAQALRVWGLAGVGGSLLLCGGRACEMVALLHYLHTVKALPPLVWIPDDPADAGAVSGLYSHVGTGYVRRDGKEGVAYAAVAPMGRAVVLA